MGRYFEWTRAVIERHGGTVQKFIGDAVMAVFGIPVVREDDALRAVRAAAELRTALAELNAELVRDYGVALELRTGVNTGEVLAGDRAAAQALALGDTVNVAARLEQVASSGEVLLGQATWALVRDAVEVTALDPLTLKGRSAPVGAWRLEMVKPVASGRVRRLDRPMVGRETERARLRRSAENAAGSRSCHLATVVGAAGVGKSRLVAEVLADLEGTASRRRAARPSPARCSPRRPERSTARATSRPPLKPAPGCRGHGAEHCGGSGCLCRSAPSLRNPAIDRIGQRDWRRGRLVRVVGRGEGRCVTWGSSWGSWRWCWRWRCWPGCCFGCVPAAAPEPPHRRTRRTRATWATRARNRGNARPVAANRPQWPCEQGCLGDGSEWQPARHQWSRTTGSGASSELQPTASTCQLAGASGTTPRAVRSR
jgi:hypothetical protein